VAALAESVELGGQAHRHIAFLDDAHRVRGKALEHPALASWEASRERLHRMAGLGQDLREHVPDRFLPRTLRTAMRTATRVDERERSESAHARGLPEHGARPVQHVEHVHHQGRVERAGSERQSVAARADEPVQLLPAGPSEHPQREVRPGDLEARVGERTRDPTGSDADLEDRVDAGTTQLPCDPVDRGRKKGVPGRIVDPRDLVERLSDLFVRHGRSRTTVDAARWPPAPRKRPARSPAAGSTEKPAAPAWSGRTRTSRRGTPRSGRRRP
jgi:hypothetical protein